MKIHDKPPTISCMKICAVIKDHRLNEGLSLWQEEECEDRRADGKVQRLTSVSDEGDCTFVVPVTVLGVSTSAPRRPARRKRNNLLGNLCEVIVRLLMRVPPPSTFPGHTYYTHQCTHWSTEHWSCTRVPRAAFVFLSCWVIMLVWKHGRWNQKFMSGCFLFASSGHNIIRKPQSTRSCTFRRWNC